MAATLRAAAIATILLAATALTACNDDNTLGESLVEDQVAVEIYEAPAPTGASQASPSIQSRSITQLLGRLNAPGYGKLRSDIVTQFLPAIELSDSITAENLDSVCLTLEMYTQNMTGDSIVPMGVQVHRLTKALPAPIFSDFDPAGYYDPQPYATAIYAPSNIGTDNDSIIGLATRTVSVKLPLQFGLDLISRYKTHPETFLTPQAFTQWFPGFYIANSFGSGRVIRISRTAVRLYAGTNTFMAMAVTPEVINNSGMTLTLSPSLTAKAEAGEALIVAPVGYDVSLTLPIKQVIDHYRANTGRLAVTNSLVLTIPAQTITNDFDITPPADLLLVRASEKDTFFAQNKIPDNVTSFHATYNNTTHTYEFDGMKAYIDQLLRSGQDPTQDDAEFILTPINITTENSSYGTTTYVTGVAPYVGEPKMVKLTLPDAKFILTYSKQSLNNL